jgi:hypothetical protein
MSSSTSSPRPRLGPYRAGDSRHALIVRSLDGHHLGAFVGDAHASGAAALDVGPVVVLDVAGVRALHNDLGIWLNSHAGEDRHQAGSPDTLVGPRAGEASR